MTIPCDMVLLPAESQADQAMDASGRLSSQGSLFSLDNKNFYAHTSLYMFQMDTEKQNEILSFLERLTCLKPIQILLQEGYFYEDKGFGKGYIDISFERNADVDTLQMKVVDVVNQLRSGMREKDIRKMQDATGLKLENLQKYGYPAVGELFRPHITLTKFPADIEPDLSVLPDPSQFTGVFDRIGLFEMGDNGTCIREIATFRLGSKNY